MLQFSVGNEEQKCSAKIEVHVRCIIVIWDMLNSVGSRDGNRSAQLNIKIHFLKLFMIWAI